MSSADGTRVEWVKIGRGNFGKVTKSYISLTYDTATKVHYHTGVDPTGATKLKLSFLI